MELTPQTVAVLIGCIALAQTLAKILDTAVGALVKRARNGNGSSSEGESDAVAATRELHQETLRHDDREGSRFRVLADKHERHDERTLEILHKVSTTLEVLSAIQQKEKTS